MRKNLAPLLTCTILALFIFLSCKKETSITGQQNETQFATVSSQSDAEAELIFDDVFDNVMGVNAELAFGETGVFSSVRSMDVDMRTNSTDSLGTPCFTVSITRLAPPALFPVKVVTDFGTGCVGRDGRTRKGKIITVYTGRLTVPGKVAETIFDGYYINNIHVEGTHRIKNNSTSQVYVFQTDIQDGKITKSNSNYTQWNSKKTYSQIEGLGTTFWPKDDVFSLSSEAQGSVKTDAVFFTWTSKTLEPLIKNFTCRWIVKGKIGISKSSTDTVVIDYGNGDCNNKATLTINGLTKEITLD